MRAISAPTHEIAGPVSLLASTAPFEATRPLTREGQAKNAPLRVVHAKTALVRGLTEVDADHLAGKMARGISIPHVTLGA